MDFLDSKELICIESELFQRKNILKVQLIGLIFILILTIILHFVLIYINNTLKMKNSIDIALNYATKDYGLFISSFIIFIILSYIIKYFSEDNCNIFLIINNINKIRSLENKKINIINSFIYESGCNYIPEIKKSSFFMSFVEKFPFISYIILMIIFACISDSMPSTYEKVISYIPMNYSIYKFKDTEEFSDMSEFWETADYYLEDLWEINELPTISDKGDLSYSNYALDSTIEGLDKANSFLNLNISNKSEILNTNDYKYYVYLAGESLLISDQIKTSFQNNDIQLFRNALEKIEKIIY